MEKEGRGIVPSRAGQAGLSLRVTGQKGNFTRRDGEGDSFRVIFGIDVIGTGSISIGLTSNYFAGVKEGENSLPYGHMDVLV